MADCANSTFLLTRRNALIGGLTSLFIPAAVVPLAKATEINDPWDEVAVHAYALRGALDALPDRHWRVEVHADRPTAQVIRAYNALGGKMRFVPHPDNY